MDHNLEQHYKFLITAEQLDIYNQPGSPIQGGFVCDPKVRYVSYAIITAAIFAERYNVTSPNALTAMVNALLDTDYAQLIVVQAGRYSVEQWRSWFTTLLYLAYSMIPYLPPIDSPAPVASMIQDVAPQLAIVGRGLRMASWMSLVANILCYILTAILKLAQLGYNAVRVTAQLPIMLANGIREAANKVKRD